MLMKNLKNILFNENGNAVTILFLIMFPLFIMLTITSVSHARSVYGSDLDLQQALNDACRAAAMQVSPRSQSVGYIHAPFFEDVQEGDIYFDPMSESVRFVEYKPYDTFNEVLGRNLGLQETNGNSLTSDLEYYFIISIVDPELGITALLPISNDGTNTIEIDQTGIMQELSLKDLSIKYNHDEHNPKITISGDSIGRDIVINSKGNCVIGIASMEMKPILGKARTATRWSSARIVYKDPRTIEPEEPEEPEGE